MAVKLPNGSIVSLASAYASLIAVSAISNAAEAVATLAEDHGLAIGDFVEITSGWNGIDGRIARVKASAATSVTFEGIDTANANRYPAGGSAGSVRKIMSWTQLSQVLEISTSGGEQQYASYSFLEDSEARQLPSEKSAMSITVSLGDDPTKPWYAALSEADEDREQRALRIVLPNASCLLYNAFVSFHKTPSLTKNNVMAVSAAFALAAPVTRYAS
jgi:hypothetical protein